MDQTSRLRFAALIALALLPIVAVPQPALAAGAPASAEAVVVRRLSLVKTEDLDFGTLIPGAVPGTATVNPLTGARTVTGGVTAAGGTPLRAEFVGAGTIGLFTIVTLGASPTLANGTGGTMATALALDGPALRLLPGTGVQTFRVGGTLTVGANQAIGDYAGNFVLTVNYF